MGLNSEELVKARQQLFNKIVDYFVGRRGVEALFIQGSVAEDSADEYSDIDFRVVIEPSFYQQYISERFSAPKQWGKWVYNEWAGRTWVCVSHFKPFNKIDMLYFKPEELKPSPWFALSTQVIYDSKGLVQEIIGNSQNLEQAILDVGEIDRLISKGLAYAEEVYRRVMRGELFYAQFQLDSFRSVLIQLDDYLHQNVLSSGFGSPSHFEKRGSKKLVKTMQLSYATLETQSILQALKVLLDDYQAQITKIYEVLPLKRDLSKDLDWINNIAKLCNE